VPSFSDSRYQGCWEFPDNVLFEEYQTCCRGFLVWKPSSVTPTISQAYQTALKHILDANNGAHEGMLFGRLAADLGFERCVEVGVFGATWTEFFLAYSTDVDGLLPQHASGVQEHTAVYLWLAQLPDTNHKTMAKCLSDATKKLHRFWPRVRFVQQPSHAAARLFDDSSVDFVFIDAGHDECSVRRDVEAWWPKVRPGGLMAGDDYVDADAAMEMYSQNWSRCANGEVRPGAVRTAVDGFAASRGLRVSVFRLRFSSLSPQWLIFKP